MLKAVVLTVLMVTFACAQDYCSLCSDHTMCVYQGIGQSCQKVLARGFSDAARNEIVAKHNELRDKVARGLETLGGGQPSASNMKKVSWDSELATIAQRWTDQCNFGHDKCRKVASDSWVGQNAFIISGGPCSSWNSNPLGNSATQSWYNEVKDFSKNNIEPFQFTGATGHYTQLVWATTTRIGCGFTSYQNGDTCKNYIVCNYAPGGNIIGTSMYKKGTARSSCAGSALDSKYPGLCG